MTDTESYVSTDTRPRPINTAPALGQPRRQPGTAGRGFGKGHHSGSIYQETAWSPFAANSGDSGWDDSGNLSGQLIRRHRDWGLAGAQSIQRLNQPFTAVRK